MSVCGDLQGMALKKNKKKTKMLNKKKQNKIKAFKKKSTKLLAKYYETPFLLMPFTSRFSIFDLGGRMSWLY